MDTTKHIARAVLNKNFAEAKELVFKSLYARASLSLDEARYAVADAVFNSQPDQLDEVSPPGMEKMTGSKKVKAAFTKRYGKRGKEVMYATAWKQHNKKMAEETEQIDEVMTRKHFQQVADVIKSNPDAKKREELAAHHSQIFKKSNPRFDEKRFRKACGVGGCD